MVKVEATSDIEFPEPPSKKTKLEELEPEEKEDIQVSVVLPVIEMENHTKDMSGCDMVYTGGVSQAEP